MTRSLRLGALGLFIVLGAGAAAGVQAAPRRATPSRARRSTGAVRSTPLPPNSPGVISTTAQDEEGMRAEKRLASFIRALQAGRRERAVRLLSSRVTPQERQGLLQKRWLRANPADRKDFFQILYGSDIQIRTLAIFRDTRRLSVTPRVIPFMPKKKSKRPTAYLEVRMRKEQGEWWVDLHPRKQMSSSG